MNIILHIMSHLKIVKTESAHIEAYKVGEKSQVWVSINQCPLSIYQALTHHFKV